MAVDGNNAVNVILRPTDTARELGKNVTLACIVTDKTSSESVQWKYKPALSDAFNALTFNENVLSDPTKYGIQWTYNLTVYNLQPEDAGLYRCTAGGVDYDATLIVVDLPENVSIEMVGQPNNGETHNLTCKVINGLPPPTIRWLINGVDMTSNAVTENTTLTGTGYGDITSYLSLELDASMNGKGAECILSYGGWENAVKATYTIQTLYPGGLSNSGTGFYNPGTIVFPSGSSNTNLSSSALGNGGSGGMPNRGMFMIKFIKQSASENINWEMQQYSP
ncbi:uncharacterized protein LOC132727257 [Ruditapes philippinarum]|uniref:uncharacterized protein LOC132727257 n=1 Tax=Ruditapes philippinarum TaxID=129788 RepID=UPI00295BA5D1|nr:uncharacterized protein LOC132727257 [Ruditapes philippinarum]